MKNTSRYIKIVEKAYKSFLAGSLEFDYPLYGGNLTFNEIHSLSSEEVDAIQHVYYASDRISEKEFKLAILTRLKEIL